MNNMTLRKRVGAPAMALCVLSLTLAGTPAWSGPGKPGYHMSVYNDAAQGSKILAGKYKLAIEKINARTPKRDVVLVKTNLCVAYAKSGELEQAAQACDEAVLAAQEQHSAKTHLAKSLASDYERYYAIALSNRGVLKAIAGDLDAAREDFDAAMALRSRLDVIRTNIELLETARAQDAA